MWHTMVLCEYVGAWWRNVVWWILFFLGRTVWCRDRNCLLHKLVRDNPLLSAQRLLSDTLHWAVWISSIGQQRLRLPLPTMQ
jgi:hypothetical protein